MCAGNWKPNEPWSPEVGAREFVWRKLMAFRLGVGRQTGQINQKYESYDLRVKLYWQSLEN